MMIARLLIPATFLFASNLYAFPCYVTFVKNNCWTDYNVNLVLTEAITNKNLLNLTVLKGKSWVRGSFECEARQKLKASATFSPLIWETDAGKVYFAKNFIFLPDEIDPSQSAWEVPICYPAAFTGVSLPPTAEGQCTCDFSVIPPIPPKKI